MPTKLCLVSAAVHLSEVLAFGNPKYYFEDCIISCHATAADATGAVRPTAGYDFSQSRNRVAQSCHRRIET